MASESRYRALEEVHAAWVIARVIPRKPRSSVQFQRIAMQLQLDQPPLARKAAAANTKATAGHGGPAERISG
jgi:hypothetical protein